MLGAISKPGWEILDALRFNFKSKIIVIIYPYLCDRADDTEFSCVVPLLEILLLFISESLLGDDQGPEPLPRHVVHLLVEAVVVLHDGGHHGVRALHIK